MSYASLHSPFRENIEIVWNRLPMCQFDSRAASRYAKECSMWNPKSVEQNRRHVATLGNSHQCGLARNRHATKIFHCTMFSFLLHSKNSLIVPIRLSGEALECRWSGALRWNDCCPQPSVNYNGGLGRTKSTECWILVWFICNVVNSSTSSNTASK